MYSPKCIVYCLCFDRRSQKYYCSKFFFSQRKNEKPWIRFNLPSSPLQKICITILIFFNYPIYARLVQSDLPFARGTSWGLDPNLLLSSIFSFLKTHWGVNISSRHEKLTHDTLPNVLMQTISDNHYRWLFRLFFISTKTSQRKHDLWYMWTLYVAV